MGGKTASKAVNADVREKIIRVSRELFIKKGFKGTTIRDIAAAAGVNVAMVNYYFQSKNKLFETIFEESFGMLVTKIFTAVDSDLPFFEMVRKWIYAYYEVLKEMPDLPIFVLSELGRNPEMFEQRLRLKDAYQIYARLAIRMNEEQKKGIIRKIAVSDFLLNVASMSIFPFVFAPVATSFLNLPKEMYAGILEEHKESVVDFIINALKTETSDSLK